MAAVTAQADEHQHGGHIPHRPARRRQSVPRRPTGPASVQQLVEANSLLAPGTYTAQAEQPDVAGNIGLSTANTFTITTLTPDTTPPVVALTTPANGSSTFDTTPTFSGTAGAATGDSTTVSVKVFAGTGTGGTPLQTLSATRSGSGSYSVDASPALTPGTYTAQADQTDVAGNTGSSAANTFTIEAPAPDTTPPVIALAAPVNGSSTSDTTPLFSGAAGTAPGDSTAVTVNVFTGTGAGGTLLQTLTATRAGDGSYSVEATSPLALGTYTAQAGQTDIAGNTGLSAAATFTIVEPPLLPPYTSAVLSDAPQVYWRLGEANGPTAADETGAAPGVYLNGVTLGAPGVIAGDANKAARLDGANDQVNMGDPASGSLDFGTGDLTVEVWIKTLVNREQAVISKQDSGPYWQVTVTDDSGHVGQIRAKLFDGAVTLQAYGPAVRVNDGTWRTSSSSSTATPGSRSTSMEWLARPRVRCRAMSVTLPICWWGRRQATPTSVATSTRWRYTWGFSHPRASSPTSPLGAATK